MSASEEVAGQTLETEWKSSRGTERVTTNRQLNEELSAFINRHNSAVAALQEDYPPVN